jgi:hypothetical protein
MMKCYEVATKQKNSLNKRYLQVTTASRKKSFVRGLNANGLADEPIFFAGSGTGNTP